MTNDSQNDPSKAKSHADVADDALTPLARRFLWVEAPSKLNRAILFLGAVCLVLFVLDFIIHRHSYAPYEGTPGFYALTGFLAFSFIVLGSSALRWFIARSEGYYSPNSVDTEEYPEEGLQRRMFTDDHDESDPSNPTQSGASASESGRLDSERGA